MQYTPASSHSLTSGAVSGGRFGSMARTASLPALARNAWTCEICFWLSPSESMMSCRSVKPTSEANFLAPLTHSTWNGLSRLRIDVPRYAFLAAAATGAVVGGVAGVAVGAAAGAVVGLTAGAVVGAAAASAVVGAAAG